MRRRAIAPIGDDLKTAEESPSTARCTSPRVACCFKTREASDAGGAVGTQTRWSVVARPARGGGVVVDSTAGAPVRHVPKDECGGGSAWSAGAIDAMLLDGADGANDDDDARAAARLRALARRGDTLAALCQEAVGDHSTATRGALDRALGAAKPDEPLFVDGAFLTAGGAADGGGDGAAAMAARIAEASSDDVPHKDRLP